MTRALSEFFFCFEFYKINLGSKFVVNFHAVEIPSSLLREREKQAVVPS